MGLNFVCSSDSYLNKAVEENKQSIIRYINNSPDPKRYKILDYKEDNKYLLIKIKYLDCTNYEGEKILLYKTSYMRLISQQLIDPHFSENKNYISPIARFEPTEYGWELGKKLIKELL